VTRAPTLAVTGASGFFGRALERRLAPRGDLRGLFRSEGEVSRAWRTKGHRVVRGDLSDRAALDALVDGADVVYHLAARKAKDDAAESRRVNVEGTARLARAAGEAGVGRLLYVSSISVYAATRTDDGTITEEVEPRRLGLLNPYSRTKYRGEEAARGLAERGRAPPVTVVRPTNVYGPWGRSWFLDWVERIRRLPVVIGGDIPVDVVHVDDVARGMILAAESADAAGETLHLGHQRITLADFVARIGDAVGVNVRRLPASVDRVARFVIEKGHRAIHGNRMGTSLTTPVEYPHGKARRLVGYDPRITVEEGMRELGRWYREVWEGGG